MVFQEVIKNLMEEKHLTQQALADALGINQTTVGQWLSGKKKPSYDSILLLYQIYQIEPNELFGIE